MHTEKKLLPRVISEWPVEYRPHHIYNSMQGFFADMADMGKQFDINLQHKDLHGNTVTDVHNKSAFWHEYRTRESVRAEMQKKLPDLIKKYVEKDSGVTKGTVRSRITALKKSDRLVVGVVPLHQTYNVNFFNFYFGAVVKQERFVGGDSYMDDYLLEKGKLDIL